MKTNRIVIRCSDGFKHYVEKTAESKGISTSAYVTMVLKESLDALPKEQQQAVKSQTPDFDKLAMDKLKDKISEL